MHSLILLLLVGSVPDFGVGTAILNPVDIFCRWCKSNFGLQRGHVKSFRFKSAKLRAISAPVPTCLVFSRAHVSLCLACLFACVPRYLACLRAQVPTRLACSCAYLPMCLTCLRAYVPTRLCMPTRSCSLTSKFKNKFSMTCFPQSFGIFSFSLSGMSLEFFFFFFFFFFFENSVVHSDILQPGRNL